MAARLIYYSRVFARSARTGRSGAGRRGRQEGVLRSGKGDVRVPLQQETALAARP